MKINAMDVGPVGTINSGLSPHLREAKKKRKTNQGLELFFFFFLMVLSQFLGQISFCR